MGTIEERFNIELNNRDDVEEVTNDKRALRMVRDNVHNEHGLPLRLIGDVHRIGKNMAE